MIHIKTKKEHDESRMKDLAYAIYENINAGLLSEKYDLIMNWTDELFTLIDKYESTK